MIDSIGLIGGLALRAFLEVRSWKLEVSAASRLGTGWVRQLIYATQFIILHSIHHSSFIILH
jgi:hypothetical protein